MVSKIDFQKATKEDFKVFAKKFYQEAAKKYNLDIILNFNDNSPQLANTASNCTYNSKFKPTHFHIIDLNINKIFKEMTNPWDIFFEFINCLYHELYHVLVIERANLSSCFNLTSLFSVVEYCDTLDKKFWQKNYQAIDEEAQAYCYGIKKAVQFIQKYYPELNATAYTKQLYLKHYLIPKFYNYYTYNNEQNSKKTTLVKMLNNFKYLKDYPYPEILKKVYNFQENHLKTIDELIYDFEYFYRMYQNDYKKQIEIKNFYTTLIVEKYQLNENVSSKNKNKLLYFLKNALTNEKKQLHFLKQIHPYNLDILNKQNQFIYEQVNKINQINTSINALK